MVLEANRIFKLKRAVNMLETAAHMLQKRWLKHRYPFGLPKYRHRREEAAMLFQARHQWWPVVQHLTFPVVCTWASVSLSVCPPPSPLSESLAPPLPPLQCHVCECY